MVTKGFLSQKKNPEYPSLDTTKTEEVAGYLVLRNILQSTETVRRIEPAGSGCRNATLRIVTNDRTFVLKQFRDWPANGQVAPAANERFNAECQFYRAAKVADCVGRALPEVLHCDTRAGCILFEDIGAPKKAERRLVPDDATALAWFLVALHHHSQSVPAGAHYRNSDVIRWQRQRLFGEFPGAARGDHGYWHNRLADRGETVRHALALAKTGLESPGSSLVHGDFTPGNWIRGGSGNRIVDAEFSFFGPPEFDVGSFLASLLVTGQDESVLAAAITVLARGCFRYDPALSGAFAGVHLCTMLEEGSGARGMPRGQRAESLLDRVAAAMNTGSLKALVG